MSIRVHSALTLMLCFLAGVVASVWVGVGYYRHSQETHFVARDSVVRKQVETLGRECGQFLLTADLVVGSGESYLADGNRRQRDTISAILEDLLDYQLARSYAGVLRSIAVSMDSIVRCVDEAAATTGGDRDSVLATLLVALDEDAALLISDVELLQGQVSARAEARILALGDRLKTLHAQTAVIVGCYLLVVVLAWLFQSRTIIRPLARLSAATTRARITQQPLGVAPTGPRELRCLVGEVGDFVDRMLSETHRIESVVEERSRELVLANKAKDDFLAAMSHEMRTPLHGVLGMLDVLRLDRLSDSQRESVEVATESAEHLLELICGILDFAKVGAGMMQLEQQPFDLRQCIADVVAALQSLASAKGIRLEARGCEDLPFVVLGDSLRLRQVLFNLIGNGIKYTEHGSVQVAVAVGERGGSSVPVHISVLDTGIGISRSNLAHLFEPFVQADSSVTRQHGGTGLGLALSRDIVQLMGGRIEVESEEGRGSTFHVWLDMQPCPGSEEDDGVDAGLGAATTVAADVEAAVAATPRLKVLLVEDSEVNQLVARRMLERAGHDVDLAQNGKECIDLAAARPYDLVLMDLMMPVMGGLEATSRLRSMESRGLLASGTADPLPIVALTANAARSDRAECQRAGMAEFLSKPLRYKDLLDILGRVLVARVGQPPV